MYIYIKYTFVFKLIQQWRNILQLYDHNLVLQLRKWYSIPYTPNPYREESSVASFRERGNLYEHSILK